jgi:hypothetical protein
VQGLEFIAEGVTKAEAKTAVVEIAIQEMISPKYQKNEDVGVGVNESNCPWTIIASPAPRADQLDRGGVAWGSSRGGGGLQQPYIVGAGWRPRSRW